MIPIFGAIFCLILILALLVAICAPEGYQDEEGFHYGTPPAVVCAWCGQVMRAGNLNKVSHGICAVCLRQEFNITEASHK